MTYKTCCVQASGRDINQMREHPKCREVSYRTMLKHCSGILDWAEQHNYDRRKNAAGSHGLTLKGDWAVSYHKSVYRGKPCYYLVWSSIEFIWAS